MEADEMSCWIGVFETDFFTHEKESYAVVVYGASAKEAEDGAWLQMVEEHGQDEARKFKLIGAMKGPFDDVLEGRFFEEVD